MSKMFWFLLAATGFLLIGNSSLAQLSPDDRTLQYLNSEPHKKMITMVGLIYDQRVFDRKEICQTGYKWEPVSFAILQPFSFQDDAEHPSAGAWTYRFRFNRCNESIVYNVLFQGQNGKQPRPTMLVPGTTRTSPRLASDLMRGLGAAAAIAGVPADCKDIKVFDTKVTAGPFRLEVDGKVHDGVWEERWNANACQKDFSVDFCLTPQITGGTDWALRKCSPS